MSSTDDAHILGLAYVPFLLCPDGLVFLGSGDTLCVRVPSLVWWRHVEYPDTVITGAPDVHASRS